VANARLGVLPLYLFGKTGTSTASNAFRTQGWIVGLAADHNERLQSSLNTVKLAVLVFLKKSHGSQCAEIARPIFLEYAKSQERGVTWQHPGFQRSNREPRELEEDRMLRKGPAIRLHGARDNTSGTLSLEEYLVGVLAGEASVEDQLEALKAQAVISRTFALKNHGRHETEGYDFCSTTHCQRFEVEDTNKVSRSSRARLRAIAETAGEVLTDEKGQWVDAYFHAACGGMTADIGTLWGMRPPSYLLGVRDDFCATMPHRSWTQTIPRASLAQALHSDPRSDVGPQLNRVAVIRRDATGRAEVIAIEGNRRRFIGGWEFKPIVGRSLGWNILKSSRFDVSRNGEDFTFYGSGFGHGLGLCQEGAHVMARRGASYRQILGFYFPKVRLGNNSAKDDEALGTVQPGTTRVSGDGRLLAPLQPVSGRLTLSSEHFRVTYPAETERAEIEKVLNILESTRNDLSSRLALASLTLTEPSQLEVVIHQTTQNFVAATGQPGWVAGATRGWRIQLQPLRVLRRRGALTATLRHEYAHAVIQVLSGGRAARWLAEGLAIHVAREGEMFSTSPGVSQLPLDELEHRLASPASREAMRALYAAAYQRVQALIRAEREASLWRQVAGS
jgi:stage II sporulation protein D